MFLSVVTVLGVGSAWFEKYDRKTTVEAAGVQAPRFEVDPMWPKPLPNHWIMGNTIGVSVDSKDHIWIIHRAGSLEREGDLCRDESAAPQCCAPAPPVLEFDQDGDLHRPLGRHRRAGLRLAGVEPRHHVDYKGNVWIGGNGRGSAPATGELPAMRAWHGCGTTAGTNEGRRCAAGALISRQHGAEVHPGRQVPDADRQAGAEQGQQRHRESSACPPRRSSIPRPTNCTSPTATATIA